MATRSFLKPLSIVLAALTSGTTSASINESTLGSLPTQGNESTRTISSEAGNLPTLTNSAKEMLVRENGNIFKFVLSRSDSGSLVAQHYSHESHSSHSSHRSHYSSAP